MRHRHYTEMNEKMPSSVIKLNITSSKVREIYDLDYLELDNSSTSSACSSGYSSSPESLKNFDSNSLINSLNSTPRSSFTYQNSSSNHTSSVKGSTQLHQQHHHYNHNHNPHKHNHYQHQQQSEQFTFQDFVSSIVNSDDSNSHILIVQDIARLLELKYREFKKFIENSQQHNHQTNNSSKPNEITHQAIYLNTESDLFTKIAESIFKMASEEPNGILGSKIKLRLMYESGNVIDMCPFFAYDTDTLATSEITVTLKECSTDLKKFFKAFRLFNNFVRYFSLNIHSSSFDINKRKLY